MLSWWSRNQRGSKYLRSRPMALQLGKIRRHSRKRDDLHSNLMKKVLPLVKIILTLLSLLQKRILLNVLSVWERIILSPHVLTKGLWLCW